MCGENSFKSLVKWDYHVTNSTKEGKKTSLHILVILISKPGDVA